MYAVCLVLVLAVFSLGRTVEFESLKHLKTKTPAPVQTQSVRDLIQRVIGQRSQEFLVNVDPSLGQIDTYKIVTENGLVNINGTTGVAVAMGFYYYLKYYCNSQYTWAGQQINLPSTLPSVPSPGLTVSTNDRFRYYQNVCTVSYSLVWLNWTRWERHIDWMALQGINLPLAFTGQEAIFQKVYTNMGFNSTDLEEHFGGPAFLAWSRMGNTKGWGGPIPNSWITRKLALQHKILDRMRSLGMIPVLPGFAGHVPAAITRLYPQAKVTRLSTWARFNSTYTRTYLLDFEDPLFKQIGSSFIKEMMYEFGVDHIYNADSFNEMTPKSSEPSYLASASKAVYEAMVAADDQAIWLMQAWLFHASFWKQPQIKALLTGVPLGKMIVLDLDAELDPVYARTHSFYGQPFIWCMLHNYGGTMELYGALKQVNEGPFKARSFQNTTMVGVGITPEGIYQNEVMYEFMNENTWRSEPRDISTWISNYTIQRYGSYNKDIVSAWHLLQKSIFAYNRAAKFHGKNGFVKRPRLRPKVHSSVYNCSDGHGDFDKVFLTQRPKFGSRKVWYNPNDLYKAWDLLVKSADIFSNKELFRYDLVDVTRNSLQIISVKMYSDILMAYKNKDQAQLQEAGNKFIKLITDLDTLLNSDSHFLLGNWIGDAKMWAINTNESTLFEYNARNQITLWGPDGEIVDYASKQWAGLFQDYYKPRWQLFIDTLLHCVASGQSFNQRTYNDDVMNKVEKPFTFSQKVYPRTTTGDSISVVKNIHQSYRPQTQKDKVYYLNLDRWSKTRKRFMKYVRRWTRKWSRRQQRKNKLVVEMQI